MPKSKPRMARRKQTQRSSLKQENARLKKRVKDCSCTPLSDAEFMDTIDEVCTQFEKLTWSEEKLNRFHKEYLPYRRAQHMKLLNSPYTPEGYFGHWQDTCLPDNYPIDPHDHPGFREEIMAPAPND